MDNNDEPAPCTKTKKHERSVIQSAEKRIPSQVSDEPRRVRTATGKSESDFQGQTQQSFIINALAGVVIAPREEIDVLKNINKILMICFGRLEEWQQCKSDGTYCRMGQGTGNHRQIGSH